MTEEYYRELKTACRHAYITCMRKVVIPFEIYDELDEMGEIIYFKDRMIFLRLEVEVDLFATDFRFE